MKVAAATCLTGVMTCLSFLTIELLTLTEPLSKAGTIMLMISGAILFFVWNIFLTKGEKIGLG